MKKTLVDVDKIEINCASGSQWRGLSFGITSKNTPIMCFHFSDQYNIDNDIPAQLIFGWYEDNLTYSNQTINYHSYCKGLRIKDIIIKNKKQKSTIKVKTKNTERITSL